MKRLFDFLASLAGVIVLSPLMAIIALLIMRERDGPILFVQERVGKNQTSFWCFKFRTMKPDTPNVATHEVQTSQVTALGEKLRRFKLDELPQLYNVLAGQMSLVGPRPCLPSQLELIDAREKLGVYDLRPGITGLAQVQRIDMSTPEKLAETDAQYREKQSLLMDLKLILQTVSGS